MRGSKQTRFARLCGFPAGQVLSCVVPRKNVPNLYMISENFSILYVIYETMKSTAVEAED